MAEPAVPAGRGCNARERDFVGKRNVPCSSASNGSYLQCNRPGKRSQIPRQGRVPRGWLAGKRDRVMV